jgi:hypothetical protein
MENNAAIYAELAKFCHDSGRFQERDRFLILAADSAWSAGAIDQAEQLRSRILEYNPNHLLKPYPSFDEALKSPDIQAYVQQLRRGYPQERAVAMLKEFVGDRRSESEDTLKADSPIFKLASPPPPRFDLPAKGEAPPPAVRPKASEPKVAAKSVPSQAANQPASDSDVPVSRQITVDKAQRKLLAAPVPPALTAKPSLQNAPDDVSGVWVGTTLFTLLLIMALVAVLHVFVQPFYPLFPK